MIYPMNQMIQALLEKAVDEETGELKYTEEQLEQQVQELQMEFDEKVDAVASALKNYKAEASDIKDEKLRLANRQKSAENSRERAKRFLGYLLQGEKFKNARHNIYYTKSKELVIDDEEGLLAWAKANAPGFLNEPTIRVDDLKYAITNGLDCPFAHIQTNTNMVVR